MNQAIFVPQSIFKSADTGLFVVGFLKSGVLKVGMVAEIKKQKINLIGIEAFNKKLEEVKETDPIAKSLGIILPESAEKILAGYMNQELIFRESK
jgi:translation elongation factor EF-Tu-like GTPase